MTSDVLLVTLGLSSIIVVQFIILLNFRHKYLVSLRILDSSILPNSVTSFLGVLVTSLAVFSGIVIWHYRSKYSTLTAFTPPNNTENSSQIINPSAPYLIDGPLTFYNSNGLNNDPSFAYVPLPGVAQVSRVKQTGWGSFMGNTLLCPTVTPGTLPTYTTVNNELLVYTPPMACPTATKNTCYIYGRPDVLQNVYDEHFQNFTNGVDDTNGKYFVFSNFDGDAQTLTSRVWYGSRQVRDYVSYYFINYDEWFEINPNRKFFSVSCGAQVLFNATGHEITYTLDNESNLGGFQSSKVFGGPFTFTLKNGDSIYIPETLFARYIETNLERTDGQPLE